MMSSAQVSDVRIGTAVKLAEHQRPDAERIARANQFLIGQADEGIGAFQHSQAFDETVDEAITVRARHQMKDHLGVGGRLHHGAFAHELAPQRHAVGQVAVMADRKAAGIEFGEQRLDVAQNRFAGGRIADVADSGGAGQAVDDFPPGKVVADQAEPALGMEPLAVAGDNTGSLLAAMLERMQAKRRNRSGVGMAEYAENAALFAQPVRIGVEGFGFGHHRFSSAQGTNLVDPVLLRHPDSDDAIIACVSAAVGGIAVFPMLIRGRAIRVISIPGFLRL